MKFRGTLKCVYCACTSKDQICVCTKWVGDLNTGHKGLNISGFSEWRCWFFAKALGLSLFFSHWYPKTFLVSSLLHKWIRKVGPMSRTRLPVEAMRTVNLICSGL